MNPEITIDSNVLVYAFSSQDNTKKSISKKILSDCVKISIQSINETLYVLYRKFDFKAGELLKIHKFFEETFIIKNLDITTITKGLEILNTYNYSYWDSMMLAAAIECDCKIIYSEDMHHKHLIEEKLEIINPFI
ncbi:MAG: PIN domain-containing protein [Bacteroidota bacterium]|nr:PIN domain-containing protein [Bacteroidota bacterium]